MDCKLAGSAETLRDKCMQFLVHTHKEQFNCRAVQGPERPRCPEHSLRRGFLRQD